MMYGKLTQHRGEFICLDLIKGNQFIRISGKLIELTPEYLTLVCYDEDGVKTSEFSCPVQSVAGLYIGHKDERSLMLKAAWSAGDGEEKQRV